MKTSDHPQNGAVSLQFPMTPPPLPGALATANHDANPARKKSLKVNLSRYVSIWYRFLMPFLVQHIGWFVGGFFSVTGCMFLVLHTDGFARSFVIAATSMGYALTFLVGAWQLLKRQPNLKLAASMLILTGTLLMPLAVAASVRLMDTGFTDPGKTLAGMVLFFIGIIAGYPLVSIGAGVVNRSLYGIHGRYFFGLTAVQVFVPLISKTSHPLVPAVCHLILTAILATAVIRFIRLFPQTIFIHRRRTVCFFIGTLVFTTAISLIHIARGFPVSFPNGYASPFLVLLAGILFYVDGHLKSWVGKYPLLSKFNFLCYAILAISIFNSLHTVFEPTTVALTAGVLGFVGIHYLTRASLLLFIGALFRLYYLLVLAYVPQTWILPAGIPLVLAMGVLTEFAIKRNAPVLFQQLYALWVAMTAGLTGWSLYNASAGLLPMGVGLTGTGLLYAILRMPETWIVRYPRSHRQIEKFFTDFPSHGIPYLFSAGISISLWLAPQWLPFSRIHQYGILMGIVAMVLSEIGSYWYRISHRQHLPQIFISSALAYATLAMGAGVWVYSDRFFQFPWIPVILAILFLRLAVSLRIRTLTYLSLILTGIGGAMIKMTYFPGPSMGLMETLCLIGSLAIAQRIKLSSRKAPDRNQPDTPAFPLTLFSRYKTGIDALETVIGFPLEQAMKTLWLWIVVRMALYAMQQGVDLVWIVNAVIFTLATRMLIHHCYTDSRYTGIPVVFGWITLMAWAWHMEYSIPTTCLVSSAYGLIIWVRTRWIASLENRTIIYLSPICRVSKWIVDGTLAVVIWHWLMNGSPANMATIAMGMGFYLSLCFVSSNSSPGYSFIALAVALATMGVSAKMGSIPGLVLIFKPVMGPLLAISGTILGGAFVVGNRLWAKSPGLDTRLSRLYLGTFRIPLHQMAILLSLMASVYLLMFQSTISWLDPVLVSLTGGTLLMVTHPCRNRFVSVYGVGLMAVAWVFFNRMIWYDGHPMPISWNLMPDQWLVLASLATLLAGIGYGFSQISNPWSAYARPLASVASVVLAWVAIRCVSLWSIVLQAGPLSFSDIMLFLFSSIAVWSLISGIFKQSILSGMIITACVTGMVLGGLGNDPQRMGPLQMGWALAMVWLPFPILKYRSSKSTMAHFLAPTPWMGLGLSLWTFWFFGLPIQPVTLAALPSIIALGIHPIYPLVVTVCGWGVSLITGRKIGLWIGTYASAVAGYFGVRFMADWLGWSHGFVPWLILSLLALGYTMTGSVIANRFSHQPSGNKWYYGLEIPFRSMGLITGSGALMGIITWGWKVPSLEVGITAGACLLCLAWTWRCLFGPSIGTLGWIVLVTGAGYYGWQGWHWPISPALPVLAWGYGLWLLANFACPHWNLRWPMLAIDPAMTVVAGFAIVMIGLPVAQFQIPMWDAFYGFALSGYLFLMLRNTSDFRILRLALYMSAWSSILFSWNLGHGGDRPDKMLEALIILTNLFLAGTRIWQRPARHSWVQLIRNLGNPSRDLIIISAIIGTLALCLEWYMALGAIHLARFSPTVCYLSLLMGLTSWHFYWVYKHPLAIHAGMISLFPILPVSTFHPFIPFQILPLMWIGWTGGLLAILRIISQTDNHVRLEWVRRLYGPLRLWIHIYAWLALAALALTPVWKFPLTLLSIMLLGVVLERMYRMMCLCWAGWLARVLGTVFLHLWPLLMLPPTTAYGIAPWEIVPKLIAHYQRIQVWLPLFALQMVIVTWISARKTFLSKNPDPLPGSPFTWVTASAGLAILEWGLHFQTMIMALEKAPHIYGTVQWWIRAFGGLLPAIMIMGFVIVWTRQFRHPFGVWVSVGLTILTATYIRFCIWPVTPTGSWDTLALLGMALAIQLCWRRSNQDGVASALGHIAMLLPFTAAIHTFGISVSGDELACLIAVGTLYLSIGYSTKHRLAMILAFGCFNGAFYMEFLQWTHRMHLIQVYIAPAAISVLILLHIHRHDIRKSIQHHTRLAALCVLYACSAFDFLNLAETHIYPFILSLILGLLGICLGIGLRIRSFLYTGTSFTILNVLGQLWLVYTGQDGFVRGLFLVVLGMLITSTMIGFSIHREAIMKRIHHIRMDLARWD